jgi:nitrogen regulatory protein PII
VEVIVNDHVAEAVESAIATAAHTGHRGDGKIYVLPLASARRISTGQVGTEAV